MHCLAIGFNLALFFVPLVAQLDDSLNDGVLFWNPRPEIFDEGSIFLDKPIQTLDQEEFVSDQMGHSVNDLYSDNEKTLDPVPVVSGNLDSEGINLFATANDDRSDECFPSFSSPSSRIRSRGLGGVCPNPDDSGIEALTLEEQIEQLWCSKTVVAGFANIPVCKSDGRETMDSIALVDPSELPLYEPAIALPGTVTLKECYLSTSGSPYLF